MLICLLHIFGEVSIQIFCISFFFFLENTCNRIKMKREFTRIFCMQLKLLNAIKYNVES